MSLLEEAMDNCKFLDKARVPDGYGGVKTAWTEGAEFEAAITFDTSMQSRMAGAQGVSSRYTVTTKKNMTLEYHDVFVRGSDNKIFRVTSDGDDRYTPKSAGLNMRQVTAEEWSLPNGQISGD